MPQPHQHDQQELPEPWAGRRMAAAAATEARTRTIEKLDASYPLDSKAIPKTVFRVHRPLELPRGSARGGIRQWDP